MIFRELWFKRGRELEIKFENNLWNITVVQEHFQNRPSEKCKQNFVKNKRFERDRHWTGLFNTIYQLSNMWRHIKTRYERKTM